MSRKKDERKITFLVECKNIDVRPSSSFISSPFSSSVALCVSLGEPKKNIFGLECFNFGAFNQKSFNSFYFSGN